MPSPSIHAPQAFKKRTRSVTSGSIEQPRSTLCPRADTAAISSVSVAPTLGNRSVISAPFNPAGAVRCKCCALCAIITPILAKPSKWISMGRAPSLHPPGMVMSARPVRTRSGAMKKIEERIARIKSSGISLCNSPAGSMTKKCSAAITLHPSRCKILAEHSTSERCGTRSSVTRSPHSAAAAIMGSTLFFAPGICTFP